jgi:tetratricopeptide (TPR) repeat protein
VEFEELPVKRMRWGRTGWSRVERAIFASVFLFLAWSFSEAQESLPPIIRQAEPSVVVILTYDKDGKMLGQGSGFFVSKEGNLVTSNHVLQGAYRAEARTADGKLFEIGKVLDEDKEGDLILLSAAAPPASVNPIRLAALPPEAGERVIVIGNPLGLDKTVSDGIVSAVREIPGFGRVLQVTAPISQGSSGSPIINMKGEVIGVVAFFVSGGQNLNFAIPAERIAKLSPGRGQALSEREPARLEQWLGSEAGLYAAGVRYLLMEEYENALRHFIETVKKNANHAEAHFQIGYCLSKLSRYREAVDAYTQAIRIKPADVDGYNNLCVAYNVLGRYEQAVGACRQAVHVRPDLAEAHNNLCWSYQRLGRYPEASDSCKRAIELQPDMPAAHYNLGNNYSALKQDERAMQSYKEAIRLNPDYAEAHLNLGVLYSHLERNEDAVTSYRQAVRIKPGLPEGHLDLGMAYLRLGDRGSALEEYKILKELDKGMANKLFNLIYE